MLDGLDWGTYAFFRHLGKDRLPNLESIMWDGQVAGSPWLLAPVLLITLALLWLAGQRLAGQRRTAAAALAALLVGVLLGEGVKLATQRTRPPDAQNYVEAEQMTGSYPSSSVLLVTLVGLLFGMSLEGLSNNRLARVAIYTGVSLWIIWLSLSQLWLGLHFLTDVVAGMIGGAGLAFLVRHVKVRGAQSHA